MDTLRSVLTNLEKEGAALGHFNVADLVLLKAVLAAAAEIRVPVLVGASEGERDFLGTHQLAALVKSLREESGLAVFLNADHPVPSSARRHRREHGRHFIRGHETGIAASHSLYECTKF